MAGRNDKFRRALAKRKGEIMRAGAAGAYLGALAVEGESKKRTPVEYGNLRGSAQTTKTDTGAIVAYSAEYAFAVHEKIEEALRGKPRPSGLGSYWNPGRSKFLQSAADDLGGKVRALVQDALRRVMS